MCSQSRPDGTRSASDPSRARRGVRNLVVTSPGLCRSGAAAPYSQPIAGPLWFEDDVDWHSGADPREIHPMNRIRC